MPQDRESGAAGRESGIKGIERMVKMLSCLELDEGESDHQKKVLRDKKGNRYWLKTGLSSPVLSNKCLGKYEYVLILDADDTIYRVSCQDFHDHTDARPSKSRGHGVTNPHTRLAMKCVRGIGVVVNPGEFTGV